MITNTATELDNHLPVIARRVPRHTFHDRKFINRTRNTMMAKYYVQSGNLTRIIDSASAERAAIWAVHQAMQQIAPQFGDAPTVNVTTPESIVVLGEDISISEVGFRCEPTQTFDTFTAFRRWYALCELVDLQ